MTPDVAFQAGFFSSVPPSFDRQRPSPAVRRTALLLLAPAWAAAQASLQPPGPPPSPAEVRAGMAVPSTETVRGQLDGVGYARTAEQMAKVWELSARPPAPESFGPRPAAGLVGAICPHDDYLYAGRVYRQIVPLVTARTVVLVGVFHRYRRFGVRDRMIFDPYRAWRSPDGEIPVSALRQVVLSKLAPGEVTQDAAMHDSEHSVEAIAYWLRHQRTDLEILPILVPAMSLERMEKLAGRAGGALAEAMRARGLALGRDVAVVVSSDGVHYGADFGHVPFGEGGVEAYARAMAVDRAILLGPLSGAVGAGKAGAFSATCVDPDEPDRYRLTWCGRFSVPFGLLLLEATARALGEPPPSGVPVALAASVDVPELPLRALGLGATAPASLYHFVSHPAVAYVAGAR
ncbi:MAG TPA: AmmeMemoRadiSam system protein B [Anaeromyxobacteraceae bacterium]|nr:AmmeMemoRadiSam system protein B [Anaeromyxobacteraceae bacterium]